jgi:hypothetical protein
MKPQHILMLKKVGKGLKGRVFFPGEVRTMDVREGDRRATKEEIDAKNMDKLEKNMEGMGLKKAKRKPLKFKL